MSHGPHVDSTKGKDGKHDQKAVRATAQAALNDPSLHFEPVTEYDGVFNGRDGTFKTFHVSKA